METSGEGPGEAREQVSGAPEGRRRWLELPPIPLARERLLALREQFAIQALGGLGEYLEVLGPVLQERGVDTCLALIKRYSPGQRRAPLSPGGTHLPRRPAPEARQAGGVPVQSVGTSTASSAAGGGGERGREREGEWEEGEAPRGPGSAMWAPLESLLVLTDVLRLVCSLTAHRKFAGAFVDKGGVQLVLGLPRVQHTWTSIAVCLFGLASLLVWPLSPGYGSWYGPSLLGVPQCYAFSVPSPTPWHAPSCLVCPLSPGTTIVWYLVDGARRHVVGPHPGLGFSLHSSCCPKSGLGLSVG